MQAMIDVVVVVDLQRLSHHPHWVIAYSKVPSCPGRNVKPDATMDRPAADLREWQLAAQNGVGRFTRARRQRQEISVEIIVDVDCAKERLAQHIGCGLAWAHPVSNEKGIDVAVNLNRFQGPLPKLEATIKVNLDRRSETSQVASRTASEQQVSGQASDA